jgi:TRAP-type uncharacterized transport system fused permease subunit
MGPAWTATGAVYDPALMMQGDPSLTAVVYVVVKAVLAIFLWGSAATGYLWAPLGTAERVFAAIAAAFLVVALPLTDEIGFAAAAAFVAWHRVQRRRMLRTA